MNSHHSGSKSSTSTSLLERVRLREETAWDRLVSLYTPLVYGQCRGMGISEQDAPDVVQVVFTKVFSNIHQFRQSEANNSFTAWLTTIARNASRDYFKKEARQISAVGGTQMRQVLQELPNQDTSEPTTSERSTRVAAVVERASRAIQVEFEPRTWEAFWKTTVDGIPPANVAEDLGVSKWVVYQSKSRVLRRLRKELEGLL